MPTIGRNLNDFIRFTPQTKITSTGGISIAGQNNRYNGFMIDGAVNNDVYTKYREQRRRPALPTGVTTPTLAVAVTKLPELRTGPVVMTPEDVPSWALTVDDALFRKALLHLQRHGSMNEGELTSLVGGPRRARTFASSLESWRGALPFKIEVSGAEGATVYRTS